MVYIEEAHPTDGWQMPGNIKDNVLVASAKSLLDRDEAAHTCVVKLGIHIPAVVDNILDTTERAYTGWPDRLYLIDTNNRVVYKSKPGPFGFKPDDLRAAVANLAR